MKKQSNGYYEDYHLKMKQLEEKINHYSMKQKTSTKPEKRGKEGASKTTCSMKNIVNEKPSKLSDEGVKNNLLNHSDNCRRPIFFGPFCLIIRICLCHRFEFGTRTYFVMCFIYLFESFHIKIC